MKKSTALAALAALLAIACLLMFESCAKAPAGKAALRIDGDEHGAGLGAQVEKFADLNNDGRPEILASAPFGGKGSIRLYSGSSGALIYKISSDPGRYSLKFFCIMNDLNTDGVPEIAASSSGSDRGLWIFSGKDGAPLFRAEGQLFFDYYEPPRVLSVPDKNSDGIPDIAFEQPRKSLLVFSGKDGGKIMELDPPENQAEYARHDRAPDINGDGQGDIIALRSAHRPISENRFEAVTRVTFLSSADFSQIGEPFDVPLPCWPKQYACADMNGDGIPDIVASHPSGGTPDGSVLLAVSGKDGSEIWRVNGNNIRGGAKMMNVDAKTGKVVSEFADVNFGDAMTLLPDINDDGAPEVATGHPSLYNKDLKRPGRIYVFSGKDGIILNTIYSPDRNSCIGASIAPFADVNRKGTPDILTGFPGATVREQKEVGSIVLLYM